MIPNDVELFVPCFEPIPKLTVKKFVLNEEKKT